MGYSIDEQEIILTYDKSGGVWNAWCTIPSYGRKLAKQGWELLRDDGMGGTEWQAPASAVTVRKATVAKKNLSEEQKERLATQLAKARVAKNNAS